MTDLPDGNPCSVTTAPAVLQLPTSGTAEEQLHPRDPIGVGHFGRRTIGPGTGLKAVFTAGGLLQQPRHSRNGVPRPAAFASQGVAC